MCESSEKQIENREENRTVSVIVPVYNVDRPIKIWKLFWWMMERKMTVEYFVMYIQN